MHFLTKMEATAKIPKKAILESEKAKDPKGSICSIEDKKPEVKPKGDPYSEDRVSKTIPSPKDVQTNEPDDTVMPG